MNDPCGKCAYSPSLKVLATYTVTLPIAAVSQNRLSGRTASTTRRMYSALRNKFEKLITPLLVGIPNATAKRRVTFTRVFSKGKRRFDDDNVIAGFKGARDVLTRTNMLIDDTAKFAECHYAQQPGPEDCVIITLEDVEWAK